MTCSELRNALPSYAEEQVSSRLRTAVESHLASCDACRREKRAYEQSWALLDAYEAPPVTPSFTTSVMRKVREEERARRLSASPFGWLFNWRRNLALGTGVALAVALGVALNQRVPSGTAPTDPPLIATQVVRQVSDEEVIKDLEVYEHLDLLQYLDLARDLEAVQQVEVASSREPADARLVRASDRAADGPTLLALADRRRTGAK